MNHRQAIALTSILVGCALVGSSAEAGVTPAGIRSFGFDQPTVGWTHLPMSKLKRDTVYTVKQVNGQAVLRATSENSASLFVAVLKPAAEVPLTLTWRWKTDALIPGADNRDKSREDAPLRVMVFFDGDVKTLPKEEQSRFKRAKNLSGKNLPFATLMYIWSEQVALETVIPSAHTSQVKMLVVASGTSGLGQWQALRRNVAEDYRRAYGNGPGKVIGIAVMTDTDNTDKKAIGEYADITFDYAGK